MSWSSWAWSKVGYEAINPATAKKSFYDLRAELPGKEKYLDMSSLKGKVVLIVNVASNCGFTPQYKGLQKLYDDYKGRGFEIIGFPCDQFAGQEPGTDSEILEACQVNHGVTFQLVKKSNVNGPDMNETFAWIKSKKTGLGGTTIIKWNFEKALISREGEVINRYSSLTKPETLAADIEKAL